MMTKKLLLVVLLIATFALKINFFRKCKRPSEMNRASGFYMTGARVVRVLMELGYT
jgi:hypothetical protein